jgi:hypothetical protein
VDGEKMAKDQSAVSTEEPSGVCRLCKADAKLLNSHIVPSFVTDWIKETSATGYLRSGLNNDRLQDGFKIKLLCDKCENIFSKFEQRFACNIFHPFVQKGIDLKGYPTGNIKTIDYSDWLLKFSVSVQWRTTLLLQQNPPTKEKWYASIISEAQEIRRQFLIGEREDTGLWENHLLFLYNPESISNIPVNRLPDHVNSYLLRSVDMEFAGTTKKVGQLTKVGPIALWTYLKPEHSKYMRASRIRKTGSISLMQDVGDQDIIKFLLLVRPKEIAPVIQTNESIEKRVEKSFKKNPERAINSMTYQTYKSDQTISASKK